MSHNDAYDNDDDAMTLGSYRTVLNGLTTGRKTKNPRDPRVLKLSAVTAAVVDLVQQQQQQSQQQHDTTSALSAGQVYAKAMAALEGSLTNNHDIQDSLATQVALLELVRVTLPHVQPTALLTATLPVAVRVFGALAAQDNTNASLETIDELGGVNLVLRGLCPAIAAFLQRLPPKADFGHVQQLYTILMHLWNDARPKVRQAAHAAALELLLLRRGNCHKVIPQLTTKYFHTALRQGHKLSNRNNNQQQTTQQQQGLIHSLALLEKCMLVLDLETLAKDTMELLAFLFQQDATAAASDFVTMVKVDKTKASSTQGRLIQALLGVALGALENENTETIIMEDPELGRVLNDWSSRVVASLLTAKPALIFRAGTADAHVLERGRILYGKVVLASLLRVSEANPSLAIRLLPLAIQMILLLAKESEDTTATTTMDDDDEMEDEDDEDARWMVAQTLFVDMTQYFRTNLKSLFRAKPQDLEKHAQGSLENLMAVLLPDYQPVWSVALQAMVVFTQRLIHGGALESGVLEASIAKCVESLLQHRNQVTPGSPSQRAVEDALSTLVQGIGIEQTWNLFRWPNSVATNGIGTDRAWILSTLKGAAMTAQPESPHLAFFQNTILEMARAMDRLTSTTKKDGALHRARVVDLWNLFPCFCKAPIDIAESLPPLAVILSKALEDKRYPQLISIISRGLTTLCVSVAEHTNAKDHAALAKASQKLLPVMFKLIASTPAAAGTSKEQLSSSEIGQQTQTLSQAVANLAKYAPSTFLHGLFKKLMHRLLDEIQSESRNEEKICSFLSLSQALVASETLDESNIFFLYRTIKPFIQTDSYGARCQKKAYKVLAEMCERNHAYFTNLERLKEMISLLAHTISTSQVAARHMRLKCLKHIVDGLDQNQTDCLTELNNVLAETLLCLKDTNAKTREAAYQLLLAIASKNQLTHFLQAVTAALGAETSHMRSAAVMALSRIVFEYAWEDEAFHALLPSLLSTVLVLMNEDSREVIKSVVAFIRVSVAAIQKEQLEPLLPELIQSLLGYHKTKDRFRAKIKIILKKLVKQYGYDLLMPHVPESETRLLTHMRKLDERRKRKKEALRESIRPDQGAFEDMVESDEEDSDDGRTLATGMTGFTRMTGRTGKTGKSSKKLGAGTVASKSRKSMLSTMSRKERQAAKLQLPNEADGEVVDMLGSGMAKRVKFMDLDGDSDSDDDGSDGGMEFDDDGKLVIHDEPDEVPAAPDLTSQQPHKRQRTSKFQSAKSQRDKKQSKSSGKKGKQLGAAYKSRKAGGDVKKKNQKFDPYAFVPLDGRSFSKKNRRTAVESMSSVVRGGKKRNRS